MKIKKLLIQILRKLGYEIRKISQDKEESLGYVLYKYINKDGSFNYEIYRSIQECGNKETIKSIGVIEENFIFLSEYLEKRIPNIKFGICHGTRRGKEQEWFRKYLSCEVIGTEISETATEFPNTIRWDYHDVKPEWIDSVDFIYSNSFDHSYDPEKCLLSWMSCIRDGGFCIIEHSSMNEPSGASVLAPFGANILIVPYLITKWGRGEFVVREILDAPVKSNKVDKLIFLIIQKL
jgi:hypothetical protein